MEALALTAPALLFVFAFTYLSLSRAHPESFTEALSRVDAVYFSMTVLTTVGFGDITATTDVARVLVMIQIVVGLVAALGLVRLLFGAADVGLRQAEQARVPASGEPQAGEASRPSHAAPDRPVP